MTSYIRTQKTPYRRFASYGAGRRQKTDKQKTPYRRFASYGAGRRQRAGKQKTPYRRFASYGAGRRQMTGKQKTPYRRFASYGAGRRQKDLFSGFIPLKRVYPACPIREILSNEVKGHSSLTGFTLIEVMISVAILSIGLVLILQGFGHSLYILRVSEDSLKATFIAENKLAEAQIQAKQGWDVFKRGADNRFKFDNMKCKWKMKITPVKWEGIEEIPEGYKSLNEVQAILAWKEGKRRSSILLSTYMRSHKDEDK